MIPCSGLAAHFKWHFAPSSFAKRCCGADGIVRKYGDGPLSSPAPWVAIDNYRIKIDGCVGESFIRSYATLAKSTDEGDGILSWYGVTKQI